MNNYFFKDEAVNIGIIGAMEQEVEMLISNLKHYRSETVANVEFYRWKIEGINVIIKPWCGLDYIKY